jgi:uncharacterized membrane protein
MEYFLSIIIIILLIFQNAKYSKERNDLKEKIDGLNEKLNGLHYLLKTKHFSSTSEEIQVDEEVKEETILNENDIPNNVIEEVEPIAEPIKQEETELEENLEPAYVISYTNVVDLNDKDISIIENILKTAETSGNNETLERLKNKMLQVLGIETVLEATDAAFIKTLLNDYNYSKKIQQFKYESETTEDTIEEAAVQTADASNTFVAAPTIKHETIQDEKLPLWDRFKQKNPDLEKFIGENLINKIGILILVLGISYFVKYAIDKDWINEPARVGIGVLAGSLVLFIAHKLRKNYTAFSSVLVAGAIAIFYFTIAIAFHEYKLFGQEVAFAIMVVITAFSCLISLSYNRMELAILSLIGGFAVPFMVSTGSGNYLVLFTYIAILDVGILIMAYFKKWQLLHILSFIFTIILFGGWVTQDALSSGPHNFGALVFAFVFYLIFMVMTTISNLRSKGTFTGVQLGMLSINNFVFYGIGMFVLNTYKPEFQGLFTAFLALLNMAYSLLLYKKFGLDKKGIYLLIGLSLTFITLAIPIQFSGNNITIFWAIEAVMLIWLSQKSQVKSYRFVAVIVQTLMLGSLLMDWLVYIENGALAIILNPVFIAGIFVITSFISVYYLLRHETAKLSQFGLSFNPVFYKNLARLLAICVAYFVGLTEVVYQSVLYFEFTSVVSIAFQYHLLFTAVLCFILYRNRTRYNNDKIVNILSVFNIIIFAFGFSRMAFHELEDNIMYEMDTNISYYLHMLACVFMLFFWYLIYSSNKTNKVFEFFKNKLAIWVAVFVLVFLTSSEVVLQGLHFMDTTPAVNQTIDSFSMIDIAQNKIIKTGLPVLWGILAFALLLWGIKKQLKVLRIIALTLLGLTIVKLFAYDISNVSETGKIVAFILLGILILIISFIYQKIKVLVIDEEKPIENEDIN